MGIDHLPILIILIPFLLSFVVAISGWFTDKYVWPLSVLALLGSSVSAVMTLQHVVINGELLYRLGGWKPPIGISHVIDHFNALMLCIITITALLVAIFAKNSVLKELPDRVSHFYTLFLLSTVGLLGMTITGDAFNLYVMLEVSSLTAYALIAMGKGRAFLATFNYIIIGTIGACFYLLGVGYLYIKTGTLNMAHLNLLLGTIDGSTAVFIGFVLIMVGLLVKMAFFPMHGWLPNAYTFAPTATSCFVAPLMTKVSVYILIRMMFDVFGNTTVFSVISAKFDLVWLAVIAIVAGALFALIQKDIKKMLTFIIVSEVGYMVGGVWLSNANGLTGAVYHILADAAMTLCLFLAVGAIAYKLGSSKFTELSNIFKKMPITMICFLVGAASMIGIPPTAGFFSKWYLISGGIEAGHWGFVIALLVSSLVNAILFVRIIEMAMFSEDGHFAKSKTDEAPFTMLLPMAASAVAVLAIGILANPIIEHVVSYVIPLSWMGAL